MEMEGDSANGEEDNCRGEECKERTSGIRNITIMMHANRDEDFQGKPNKSLKRGRFIDSKEDRQEEGKDSGEEHEKKGSGEKNEQ